MTAMPPPPPVEFRALSARLGADPLQIQGPGGNTSIKVGDAMWIKASGTELREAEARDVFVAVDIARARAEIDDAPGTDGTCRAAMLDAGSPMRPSIETTFHAALHWPVVVHTHSIATLAHAVSERGTAAAMEKLVGLNAAAVPYCQPGLPLTRAIRGVASPTTNVFVLRNHGLIVCGGSVADAGERLAEVERRLAMPVQPGNADAGSLDPPPGWRVVPWAVALAQGDAMRAATAGTLYPDHAVFLGPGVGIAPDGVDGAQKAAIVPSAGALLREDAGAIQETMLRCLLDVIARVPPEWGVDPIGPEAEAELMDWDAEAYRQKLAGHGARSAPNGSRSGTEA